jgi:Autographiviridae endonuclease VII
MLEAKTKFCGGCKQTKFLSEYTPSRRYNTGVESKCKLCRNKFMRENRAKDPERHRHYCRKHNAKRKNDPAYIAARSNRNYKKKYGLSKQEVQYLHTIQNNKCAICDVPASTQRYGVLKVDHNHTTGNIRGLLCSACNLGIGYFKENITAIKEAANYLDLRV